MSFSNPPRPRPSGPSQSLALKQPLTQIARSLWLAKAHHPRGLGLGSKAEDASLNRGAATLALAAVFSALGTVNSLGLYGVGCCGSFGGHGLPLHSAVGRAGCGSCWARTGCRAGWGAGSGRCGRAPGFMPTLLGGAALGLLGSGGAAWDRCPWDMRSESRAHLGMGLGLGSGG